MRLRTLSRSQFLPRPIHRVFGYFERPHGLARVTPPDLGFRVITPGPLAMREGLVIDYTIRLLGLPVHWRTLITAYDPPHCFVDEQMKGPYAYWRHMHLFEARAEGTVMRDEVTYALPLYLPGPLEALLHRGFVRPRLERIFEYRRRAVPRLAVGRGEGSATVETNAGHADPRREGAADGHHGDAAHVGKIEG